MNQKLRSTIEEVSLMAVPEERRELLKPLIEYIQNKRDRQKIINLNFICTHNSRRSHLAQIWAQTMAEYFGVDHVFCYSGGTEATAMFSKVAETLQNQGFEVEKLSGDSNPVYALKFAKNAHPVIGFSKKYDNPFNPLSGFAAVMTCSNADQGCPFIAGADKRIPVMFEDPKISDGTPEMAETYAQRSLEIASEMYFVFLKINK